MNRNKNETNPLAQARRGKLAGRRRNVKTTKSETQSNNQTGLTDPAEAHAKELWFRKTGTGLACFIAYYIQVIQEQQCTDDDTCTLSVGDGLLVSSFIDSSAGSAGSTTTTKATMITTATATISKQDGTKRAGQSRAAQRRKRRKGIDSDANAEVAGVALDGEDDHHKDQIQNNRPVSDHPLWQAMISALSSPSTTTTTTTTATTTMALNAQPPHHMLFLTATVTALTRPLPSTFRVRLTADLDDVQHFDVQLKAAATAGTDANDPVPAARWIPPPQFERAVLFSSSSSSSSEQTPSSLARYQSSCPKAALPGMLKELLLSASQTGLIARQELGSMLPVAALHQAQAFACSSSTSSGGGPTTTRHTVVVLDMCASPGSKTLQALEVLLSNKRNADNSTAKATSSRNTSSNPPTSSSSKFMLVANDVLQSRVDALQQAVERSGMSGTTGSITYTCQDATKFALRVAVSKPNALAMNNSSSYSGGGSGGTEPLQFDVILCDVPCSGDGTIRKDRHILTRWTPDVAHQLHTTQLALLTRALQLVKPGGMVCYSTCSMNPVENEAVVAAAMARFNQASLSSSTTTTTRRTSNKKDIGNSAERVALVECPNTLGVILRNGLSTWKVATHNSDCTNDDDDSDDDFIELSKLSSSHGGDTPSEKVEPRSKRRELLTWYATYDDAVANGAGAWKRTMWPPTSEDEARCLSRCKRLWPQDQDSGGFFLALIRKSK